MAKGTTHDRINLLTGAVLTGILIGFEKSWIIVAGFVAGFLLSTLILSPDLDLGPKKRAGVLRIFLYPYSLFFAHRGRSHSFLFGTLTRIFYGFFVFIVINTISHQMGYIEHNVFESLEFLTSYIEGYNYQLLSYKLLTWTFLGMFLADSLHIFADRIYSRFKRLFS